MRFALSALVTLAATLSVAPSVAGCRSRPALESAQASLLSVFEWFGQFGIFCKRVLKATFTAPFEGLEFLRLLLLIRLFQQATNGSGQPSDGGSPRSDAPRISSYLVGLCPAPSPSSVWNAAIGVFRRL